ncbi:glycosyltransferase family A protein [Pontibacter sp. BT731]|uniref:glycosyltransferase family 2 protein n=1 Tax=Pontibacter coccineus TaxID=3063328 RepID=UPI0026E4306B|nr:glycosyltransferase family A protein [Pontibacter sp. BT731]MDO6391764.1 glycosyltransferase family A protein [Pontibacter sp. BT731]
MHIPLISVIIPCYNHSHYLPEAVESVLGQQHPAVEVIVVDDGSTDRTREVAARYPQVRYVYQANQGLSAARNTGIRHSTGEYLVFLDADDWLFPGALETNLRHLQQHPQAAFVSGAYDNIYEEINVVKEVKRVVSANHYCQLLQVNYIGVPASAMYRRWVFEHVLFDKSLKTCEDYDIYLQVARKYPIIHHQEKIAAYRKHLSNMSSNIPAMLQGVLQVLKRQESQLETVKEKQAYKKGLTDWKNYYCKELYKQLISRKLLASSASLYLLCKYRPKLMLKYVALSNYNSIRSWIK